MAFHSMPVNFAMLKFFRVRFGDKPKNWLFPKTLRLRKKYVRNSILMAKCAQKCGLSTVTSSWNYGGQKPLQLAACSFY
jgi:hypothetical protein